MSDAAVQPASPGGIGGRPLVELNGVSKSFGSNDVLKQVSFSVAAGERVALVGENGAGKSTMAKILSGAESYDSGEYLVDGEVVKFGSPREAMGSGVAIIPQELAYVPDMTIGENLLLGHWPTRLGVTSRRATREAASRALEPFGISLDLDKTMREVSLAERQIVEVAKALVRDTRVVVLDEPTAALNEIESEALLTLLRDLSAHGLGMIYISHRFEEVMSFADRVCVLRNGNLVFDTQPGDTSREELVEKMVGRSQVEQDQNLAVERRSHGSKPLFRLRDWKHDRDPVMDGVDISFYPGEIVVLFGVRGSAAELVSDGLAGKKPEIDGLVETPNGVSKVFRNPREAWKAGVAYVPPDRKTEGLVLPLSVSENLTLASMGSGTSLRPVDRRISADLLRRSIEGFQLRVRSGAQSITELSGGNQQKVLLTSRLARDPDFYVLHEPTRGVDVGARRQIHDELRSLTERGVSIAAVTSDVEEAVILGDRILVFRGGEIATELTGNERTQANALDAAGGLVSG